MNSPLSSIAPAIAFPLPLPYHILASALLFLGPCPSLIFPFPSPTLRSTLPFPSLPFTYPVLPLSMPYFTLGRTEPLHWPDPCPDPTLPFSCTYPSYSLLLPFPSLSLLYPLARPYPYAFTPSPILLRSRLVPCLITGKKKTKKTENYGFETKNLAATDWVNPSKRGGMDGVFWGLFYSDLHSFSKRFFHLSKIVIRCRAETFFARLKKATSDANYYIWGQLSFCHIFVRNLFAICCFVEGSV